MSIISSEEAARKFAAHEALTTSIFLQSLERQFNAFIAKHKVSDIGLTFMLGHRFYVELPDDLDAIGESMHQAANKFKKMLDDAGWQLNVIFDHSGTHRYKGNHLTAYSFSVFRRAP